MWIGRRSWNWIEVIVVNKKVIKEWALNLGLMVASVFVFFVVLEALCILILGSGTGDTLLDSFTQRDDVFGWKNKPNIEGMFVKEGTNTHVKVNSKGLREKEYEYNKPNGIKRIIFLGDSFTWGYKVESKERFTDILQSNFLTENFQVINMGVGGYAMDQELLTLKEEGVKYNPDLVIVVFCINDIGGNIDSRTIKYKYILNDNNALILTKGDNLTLTHLIGRFFFQHSHIYRFVYYKLLGNPTGNKILVKVGLADDEISQLELYSNKYTPKIKYSWNLTKAIFIEIDRVSKEKGAKTLIVIIPERAQVYKEHWENAKRYYSLNESDYNLSKPNDILIEFGKENDILVLDLLPEFRKHAIAGEQLYYPDGHWNANGHQLAAELIYEKLIQDKLI